MISTSVRKKGQLESPRLAWLAFPAALHLTSTFILFLIGRFSLLPGQFDSNGVGTSFASDGTRYHLEAMDLVQTLTKDGIVAWFKAAPVFHVKIYSLSYAAFGPLVGFNIIAVEPLNALYYVTTVYLAFAIGRQLFDQSAGLLSALIIALWPSFLLHSTQLLRDPLLIAMWLILILVISGWLTTVLQWRRGLLSALIAVAASLTIWIIRMDMWLLIRATVILVTVLLIVRQLRERHFHFGNSLAAACLLTVLLVPQISHSFQPSNQSGTAYKIVEKPLPPRETIMTRRRFSIEMEAPGANSSVDKNIFFKSNADIVRYLPRAMEIGFFAPFPDTWFKRGSGAESAKWLLIGLETMAMYVIEVLACLTLWRRRRQLSVWLLCLIAGMGMVGLGLVVVNLGTIYRIRYPFLILLTIVASESLLNLRRKILKERVPKENGSPALETA